MVERPLIGNVAIVTGGSSGIGAACVRALVTAGMKVVVGARGQDHLAILEEEWGEQVAIAVRTDVRSPSDLDRLVSKATTTFGRLDALVASAGVGAYGDVLDYADDTIATMLDTNVGGTVWAVRAAVPALLASGRGGRHHHRRIHRGNQWWPTRGGLCRHAVRPTRSRQGAESRARPNGHSGHGVVLFRWASSARHGRLGQSPHASVNNHIRSG